MIIRSEMPNDIAAIRDVVEKAFDRQTEANLVEALRDRNVLTLSLVATDGDRYEGDVPPEAFMVKELSQEILANCTGIAHYQPEFQAC